MRYWIFQNNQVLGPYEPADLRGMGSLAADTLVCPEGRKGTSMGDWQKAGSVPDLFPPASAAPAAKAPAPAPLDPEVAAALRDLAGLRSLTEKIAPLEDALRRLDEEGRARAAELSALKQELAARAEAPDPSAALRERLDELSRRVDALAGFNADLDAAKESSRRLEQDVESHGASLSALSRELSDLREKLAAPPPVEKEPAAPTPPPPAPMEAAPEPALPPASLFTQPPSPEPTPFPASSPAPAPEILAASVTPLPIAPAPASSEPIAPPLTSLSELAAAPLASPPAPAQGSAPTPKPRRRRALLIGGALGAAAAASLLFLLSGRSSRVVAPAPDAEPAAPPIESPVSAPAAPPNPQAASAQPPAAAPEPTPDPRETAIEIAKSWPLPDGRSLGAALEGVSPPQGGLSPWMAEPVNSDEVQVNYFSRGSGSGAPTVAYEFAVSLGDRNVVGRNDAAKAMLAGMAAAPPAPPKRKPVKVKSRKTARR